MAAMKKNAFGGLLLLVTLAMCRATQTQLETFDPKDVSSYVWLAQDGSLAGKPSSGDGALTLELAKTKEKAQLCYRRHFKVVGTRVEGGFDGSWKLDTEVPDPDASGQEAVGYAVKVACSDDGSCHNGCVGIKPDDPLVRAVTAYRDLIARGHSNFEVTRSESGPDKKGTSGLALTRFDLLTYQQPNKEMIGRSYFTKFPGFAMIEHELKPLSTGTREDDPDEAVNMVCLQPLDANGEPLEETVWYWSVGPRDGKAVLSVDPNASRENQMPNGCTRYDQEFEEDFIKGPSINKVIWVATGGGTGKTIPFEEPEPNSK